MIYKLRGGELAEVNVCMAEGPLEVEGVGVFLLLHNFDPPVVTHEKESELQARA